MQKGLIDMAKKIVIDAGHGLNTAGKQTPNGIKEWELNNKVALAVAKQLAEYEIEIYRVDDPTGKTDVSLYDRVVKANKIMPDVLISIHHNAFTGQWGTHTGVETYYNSTRQKEIEKTLATKLANQMATNVGLRNRGAKSASFYILNCDPKITAILSEGGFMDSTIDYPIITATTGQSNYALAISKLIIEYLQLTKKNNTKNSDADENRNETPTVGQRYLLTRNTPGYYTAADALAGRDQRVSVLAGEYTIFNIANGMINITKTKGVPGSWINPGTTVTPPVAPKIGDRYQLTKNTPGFYTSADAVLLRDQRVTVLMGEYYIYNIANGMINISKTKNLPGAWINPK